MGVVRSNVSARLAGFGVSIAAVAAAFLVGAMMILALGANPIEGFRALFSSAFGGGDELMQTALKAMPLLLVGTGICIAFRAKVINIGGEGQIVAGAVLSTVTALALPGLPAPIMVPLVLLAGIVGGGIWGGIPGALKAYLGVNEILSTIMLNIVAIQVMNFLLRDPLMDPDEIDSGSRIPQTRRLPTSSDLPVLGDSRLHLGAAVAVAAAVVAWLFLWRTSTGYRIRAVGSGPEAARYAGMPVARLTMSALTASGAICGLAGAVLVFGSESHRLVTDGSMTGFTGSAGFNGIVVALFGGLHPLLTIPSSFLFGGLLVGANGMQRATQIPSALALALNGLVVVFVVASVHVRRRLQQRHEIGAVTSVASDEQPDTDAVDPSATDDTTSATEREPLVEADP